MSTECSNKRHTKWMWKKRGLKLLRAETRLSEHSWKKKSLHEKSNIEAEQQKAQWNNNTYTRQARYTIKSRRMITWACSEETLRRKFIRHLSQGMNHPENYWHNWANWLFNDLYLSGTYRTGGINIFVDTHSSWAKKQQERNAFHRFVDFNVRDCS